MKCQNLQSNSGSFPFSLVGAYYLHPPEARAILLYNDLLCNDTCPFSGEGRITFWGGGGQTRTTDKIRNTLRS